MGILDKLFPSTKKSTSNFVEVDDKGYFYWRLADHLSTKEVKHFNKEQSVYFASSIAEIYTPLDYIASRVCAAKFNIVDQNDEIVENLPNNLERLLKQPNPFITFKELVYQLVFTELASGQSYALTKMPSSFKTKSYDRITNIWILNPDEVRPVRRNDIISDPFMAKDLSDYLRGYKYKFFHDLELSTFEVNHNTVNPIDNGFKASSKLCSVERNINNLLQVYSARYNVYSKNGKGGIVYKERANPNDVSEQVEPTTRQDILDDITKRDGLTGDRNFIGVSSVPLGFVETIGKIKDLEPFKETYNDAITIAAVFDVDKELMPKEQSTTFSNKKEVEKNFWQNNIIPKTEEVCKTLDKIFYLPDNWRFKPDFEHIQSLQTDRKTSAEADKIELENIKTLNELGVDTNEKLEKWRQ